ncbi:class I histocompatibility antigen, F10 alpha chain-like [Excalfactoria chinensis]|uniref:class I histocompatibility antigen, F10 alpha chain-like n=1 Tax=Excalfactoria chinensis TaxID=46218 RepID=UPI003B3BAB35
MTDPGPGLPCFVSVRYVDGEIFVHYDSTARRFVPRTEWMKAAGAVDPEYWDRNTRIAQGNEQNNRVNLVTVARLYNQSGGSHTWQWMYGCDILEDGTTRGYYPRAYDGRDFIAFDKDTMTFTAVVPEAVPTKRTWEEGGDAEGWKHYLEETCVQWLRNYIENRRQSWGEQVRGRCDVRLQVLSFLCCYVLPARLPVKQSVGLFCAQPACILLCAVLGDGVATNVGL